VRRPIFSSHGPSGCISSEELWLARRVDVPFSGLNGATARVGVGHRGLQVAGGVDLGAAVGVGAGRGAGSAMPDQRVW
jgi:hypothetical protein